MITRVSFWLFLMCLLGAANPVAAAQKTILVMGDSLSAAYGIPHAQGWVNLLRQRLAQQDLDYQVINASITGDTTRGGLTRLPEALDKFSPHIVIIELGGNDGLRGFDFNTTRDNLLKMIQATREHEAQVLLLGIQLPGNYGPTYREKFHAIYPTLAELEQVRLVDFFLAGFAERGELMQADGIHPAAEAQPIMLENVWEQLQPML